MTDIPDHVFSATKRSGALLPDGDRLLLARLWCFADDKERRDAAAAAGAPEEAFAFPCIKTLQKAVSAAERTIYDRLGRLEDAGWIKRATRVIKGRECYGWVLAESGRYCGGPQVHLRQPKEDPAAARDASPQVDMRPAAPLPAAARRGSCGSPHHTNYNNNVSGGDVVELEAARAQRMETSLESEIERVVVESGVAGLNPGITFCHPMLERVRDGDATLDDVAAVLAEFKRRRTTRDPALPKSARLLFLDSWWTRTRTEYLGKKHVKKQASGPSLAGVREYWAKVTEAAPPDDEPYTDEDLERDMEAYRALTGGYPA